MDRRQSRLNEPPSGAMHVAPLQRPATARSFRVLRSGPAVEAVFDYARRAAGNSPKAQRNWRVKNGEARALFDACAFCY